METTNKNTPRNPGNEEVDLGILFSKTGEVFSKFFSWLRKLGLVIASFLMQVLFFLRKNLIWLILGTLIGLGFGIFFTLKEGNRFVSQMAVKTNFSSARAMFGVLDQLNSLISGGRHDDLAKILNISPAEAATLVHFEAVPEANELLLADEYKHQFPQGEAKEQVISYEVFKASLTKFDYPAYKISVVSSDATIFSKIEQGIVSQISSNKLSQRIKNSQAETTRELEETIRRSIQSLDTLSRAYSKRISATPQSMVTIDSNMIKLSESQLFRNPELELYHVMLTLNNELKALRYRSAAEKEIVEIYSPLGAFGKKESFLKERITRYSIIGFCAALFLLVFIRLFRWINELEKKDLINKKVSETV